MIIEKEYLVNIFNGDQLYVFGDEQDQVEYRPADQLVKEKVVQEPIVDIKTDSKEEVLPSKEVMILVNEKLDKQEIDTLSKLMTAINIEKDEYEIITEHPDQLKSIQHLKLFLSFHNQFVQNDKYDVIKINKGNAIYAHDLKELNNDTSKKLMLWNLLKTIV